MTFTKFFPCLVFVGLLLLLPNFQGVAESKSEQGFVVSSSEAAASKELSAILARLHDETNLDEIAAMRADVEGVGEQLKNEILQLKNELDQLNVILDSVGEGRKDEESPAVSEYSNLGKSRSEKESRLAELRLALLKYEEAEDTLEKARKKRLAQNLTHRSGNLFVLLLKNIFPEKVYHWREYLVWPKQELVKQEVNKLTSNIFVFLPSLLFLLAIIGRRTPLLYRNIVRFSTGDIFFYLDKFLMQRSFFFRIFVAIISALTLSSWIFAGMGVRYSAINWMLLFFFFWITIPLAGKAVLYRLVISRFPEEKESESAGDRFFWSAFSLSIVFPLFCFSQIFQYFFSDSIYTFVRFTTLFSALVIQVFFVRYLALQLPQSKTLKCILYLVSGNSFLLVLLEGIGYLNLVSFLLEGYFHTAVLLVLYIFFHDGIELLFRILKEYSARLFRQFIQDEDSFSSESRVKGGNLAKFAVKLLLLFSIPFAFFSVWTGTADESNKFQQSFFNGFKVGTVLVSPAMIMVAMIIVLTGWSLVHFLQQVFDRFWLQKAELTRGTKDIILTVSGYLGYAFLLFIGLNIAGFSFSGLGIIFGALSVGIGFGLQNVVNNFVSGLILVFEQPIKKGDWIVVGSTEGYVKKISIRSTIIQTFDRADVIVPNSELISSQVTNMMLYDNRGRVRISVGVAYGSDTRLVETLLLSAVKSDAEIIQEHERYVLRPRVYFQEFGESSLNFDLLCYLRNVDNKIAIRSKLNFEIERLFRENNIEIPFPQRDIHIKEHVLPPVRLE